MAGDNLDAIGDPARMTARRWYAMTTGWALLLVPTVGTAATLARPVAVRVLMVLVVLGYAACYVHGLYLAFTRRRLGLSVGLIAVMFGLWAVGIVGMGGDDGSGLYTVSFLLAAVAVLVHPPYTALATLGACALALGVAWLAGERIDVDDGFSVTALGLGMIAMFALVRANNRLRAARAELARMAVAADRERIARDLHDVLGHSLTTITVKAGLARRLLERGEDDRAVVEVTDVERLGRQALADVRATVSANRATSLASELAGAREALRAAEIRAELPHAVDDVPAELQEAFAYVVREGVTNTIRHSGASTCTVRLSAESIEVVDDGVGSPAGTPPGNGLSGLSERLAAVGGWVEAGPTPSGGYRLRAEVSPAPRRVRRPEPA